MQIYGHWSLFFNEKHFLMVTTSETPIVVKSTASYSLKISFFLNIIFIKFFTKMGKILIRDHYVWSSHICKGRALSVYLTHILLSMGSCSLRSNKRIHLYPFFCASFTRVICYDQINIACNYETIKKKDDRTSV